jgi:hypothetical protein
MNAYILDNIERSEEFPKIAIIGMGVSVCEDCAENYLKNHEYKTNR